MKTAVLYGFTLVAIIFNIRSGETITLNDYLESVKQDHPFFKKEKMSSDIEKKNREGFLGAEDWVVNSAPYLVHREPVSSGAFTPERIDMLGLGGSLDRTFWSTGGRLSLFWTSEFSDQRIDDIVLPGLGTVPVGQSRFYQHKIGVSYSHPLLQNRGGRLDRLEYELSEYNIDFAELRAAENEENFLLGLSDRFLDWALLSEQRRIARERMRLAEEQLLQTRRKRAANLVDEVDVIRSSDAVRIAEQNIVLLEANWKSIQAELAVHGQSQELYRRTPDFDIYELGTFPNLDQAVARMNSESRLLKVLKNRREQLAYQRGGLVEAGRPQLYLDVGAALQNGDDHFGNALATKKPDLSVALNFTYPLGNHTSVAGIQKTDLLLDQLNEEIKSVKLDLEAGISGLLIQIRGLEKVLALNLEQIESARQKTDEEVKLYNQGRGQLTFVISSQDNEENAKFAYAQNAANYQKLVLQYRALMDELLLSNTAEFE